MDNFIQRAEAIKKDLIGKRIRLWIPNELLVNVAQPKADELVSFAKLRGQQISDPIEVVKEIASVPDVDFYANQVELVFTDGTKSIAYLPLKLEFVS